MIRCECPHCNARVKMEDEFFGRVVRCPKCRDNFQLPEAADDEPAPARRRRPRRKRRERVGFLEWMGPTAARFIGGGTLIVLGLLVGTGGLWLGDGFSAVGIGGVGGGVALVMIGRLIIRRGGWGD